MNEMDAKPTKVLLIEDNPADALLVQGMLADARIAQFDVECVNRLASGVQRLAQGGIDVVLLDLTLPDSHGLDTFREAHTQAPTVPIIVLTGFEDETLALQSIQQGAQDYLVKSHIDVHILDRSLRYAIERKRAEDALQESELQCQAMFNQTFGYMGLVQCDGTLIDVNQAPLDISGLKREEVIGRPFWETPWWKNSPEEQAKTKAGVAEAAQGRLYRDETNYLAADGTKRVADRSFKPFRDEAGRVMSIIVEGRDITDRKRAEEALRDSEAKFRGLLESAPDAIVTINRDGRIVLTNAQTETVFGYTREELIGQTIEILLPERFRESHVRQRTDYFSCPATKRMGERAGLDLVGRRQDGAEFPAQVSLSPTQTAEGVLVTAVIRDITQRKQAEKQIRRLNADLEQRVKDRTEELIAANQELEAFSYSVSHDLRAPLRIIDGFSLALLDDCGDQLNDQGKHFLQRVRAAAQHMGRLINATLAFSRKTRGEIHHTRIDLTTLARNSVAELRDLEPDRPADVCIQDEVIGSGDAELLRVVLQNLFGNAWKFTANCKPASIEFAATKQEQETVYCVRDNGVGFDMTYADRLFGPFQRLHGHGEFEGTGIGLATVERIIRRHGGRVWAESKVGQGAAFYFTLGRVPGETT